MPCSDLSLSAPTWDDRLGAAAWTRVAESSDADAAILIGVLGPARSWQWLRDGASVDALATQSRALSGAAAAHLGEAAKRWRPRVEGVDPEADIDRIRRLGGTFLMPGDAHWPATLTDVPDPVPWGLWVRGNTAALAGVADRGVAIVGARAASRYGMNATHQIVAGACDAGIGIVSGGAFGVDTAALRCACAFDVPVVAVLAGGLDQWYPAQNTRLFETIQTSGAICSFYPPHSRAARWRFLDRNRIIAGLCAGTVVVEAGARSGALNTAKHARDLGRHLGAVPGPIDSAQSVGCHELLRSGAQIITSGRDIAEMIAPIGDVKPAHLAKPTGLLDGLDQTSARVFDAMPAVEAATVDSIQRAAGLALSDVLSALAGLEMSGKIQREGGKYRRVAAEEVAS
ncbi:MAG: DNA-processing protein DprA [Actinomycetaceae bacterium]|nr:DNA-processing protein DprA [Actinomycetaceae bacterium]MDU0970140.1 DNA-processing protein DprA [Actinomycetaceae bacterium]